MALFKRATAGDHGLSKRSDSPSSNPTNNPSMPLPWSGLRRRRLALAVFLVVAIYLFIHNIPTDVVPVSQRYNSVYGSMASGHTKAHSGILSKFKPSDGNKELRKNYEGPIRFTELASTLRGFTDDYMLENVLFPLLHPASAAKLLPLACQMRQHGHNSVHIAIMGNIEATSQDLMTLNGIDPTYCPVTWHDARPDFAKESSLRRTMTSIVKGYSYLHSALAPTVVLVDATNGGDITPLNVLETATSKIGVPVVKLPPSAIQSLPWLSMLEGRALGQMAKIEIDIVIQAHSESAGAIIRLLRSLRKANYDGLPIPRLTVELPAHADPFVVSYLSRFKWPPGNLLTAPKLTIRRRIDLKQITPAEASLRTVELFYPADWETSHVLMLSPDVELSANFMHYLYFTMLHFKYGRESMSQSDRLTGISLELPSQAADNTKPFLDSTTTDWGTFVLSQNMNSNANLFFGDRWIELHSFLSKRLENDPHLKSKPVSDDIPDSTKQPQWTQQALELMQARGQYMLFPMFAKDGPSQIAVSHQDLHQSPAEFIDSDDQVSDSPVPTERPWLPKGNVLQGDDAPYQRTLEASTPSSNLVLPSVLLGKSQRDDKDGVAPLGMLTLSSVKGERVQWYDTDEVATKYADAFSLRVGGCSSLDARDARKFGTVEYLFCDAG